MHLLTIGDFYRKRFGVRVEILCSIIIILSYLGWVAAQITALGLVFSVLSGGISRHQSNGDRDRLGAHLCNDWWDDGGGLH